MAKLYGSFVLRCWRLAGGAQRIEVEHMQSGERARVASLGAAIEWINTQWSGSATGDTAGPAMPWAFGEEVIGHATSPLAQKEAGDVHTASGDQEAAGQDSA